MHRIAATNNDISSEDLYLKAKQFIPGGNSLLSKRREMFAPDLWPAYFDTAKGVLVTDLHGREFRDFSHFGVGTNTLGYGNEHVDAAVSRCVQKGNMCTLNSPEEVYLAERLVKMHPWSAMARFARTGGEANSIAVRIARAHIGKSKIAFCGYHGWHDWYLSANLQNSQNLDKQLLSGLSAAGVPKELESTAMPFNVGDVEALEGILANGDVAAIKMEVMRSKAPSVQYLSDIRGLADKYNCLLIFDECTSGFRETFGGLHLKYGVQPDLTVLGKTLGNGYAITAVLGTGSVMSASQSTFISSTFFTERLGYMAGVAALEEMDRTKSWQVISRKGAAFKSRIRTLFDKYNMPLNVNGMDALVSYNVPHPDSPAIKTFITQEMLSENFLTGNLFYPSIAHSEKDTDDFFTALDKVVCKLSSIITSDGDIKKYLNAPIAHSTFQRLN
jgi:glutamate-1-semialdehyde 2,1-aminomutase